MSDYTIQNSDVCRYINNAPIQNTNDSAESNSVFDDANEMKVIAHRGDSDDAPENTIPAFTLAKENGYDTIECDVSWTKDNIPVILHDKTINRTSRNTFGFPFIFPKNCSKMEYEKLLKYDFGSWFDRDFKGTKIPTFDEMLKCGEENELELYIELKDDSNFDDKRAKILLDSIENTELKDKITWISFDDEYLEIIKSYIPEARLGYLTKEEISSDTIDVLNDLKTDENEVFLDIKSSKITQDGAKMLNDAGYDFEAWTVDDIEELQYLSELNCKGITTNELTKDEVNEALQKAKEE